MAHIHSLGREVEEKALVWYFTQFPGCRLLVQNYRCFRGEIDFILEIPHAYPGAWELVFVEVRCKIRKKGASRPIVSGVESLGLHKQLAMRRTAEHFLICYAGAAHTLRYDLLAWDGATWTHVSGIELSDR